MEHIHFTADQLEHMLALAKQGTSGTKFIEVDCPVHSYDQGGKKGDSIGVVTMRVHARQVGLVSCEDAGYVSTRGEVIMLDPPAPAVEDVETMAKNDTLSEENATLVADLADKEVALAIATKANECLAAEIEALKAKGSDGTPETLSETATKDPEVPPAETPETAKTEAPPADQDQPAEREPQVIAPEDVGKLEEVLPPPAGEPTPDPFAS